MQAPNAQGLAGLMSRPQQMPQQQQAMPSPQSGSPMAGLGSVQERVNAYRGNPAPLQQRYAVSQDLLDLLALQKIKSEKEAAARQMQLQLGQQQAAQGAEPMTIAQQREKEVMDLTKNELAQQRGATAEQQTAEQQEAMQRMMGGIANAPGAATAAQPKMMASGGIVAFADGGGVGDKKPLDEKARAELQEAQRAGDRNAMMMTIKKLAAAGYDVATLLPRAGMGVIEDIANTRLGRALGVDFRFPQAAYGGDRESMTPMMDRVLREESAGATPPAAPATPSSLGAGAGRGMVNPPFDPNAPMPPQTAPGAAPTPRPTTRPAPAGLAGLPGAQGAAPTPAAPGAIPGAAPAAPGFEGDVKAGILGALKTDAAKQGQEYGKSVQERLMFPEEQERRRATIAEQRKLYEQEFDPERQRREKLQRFLLGAGGRRYGEFAGGAGAALDYETAQRAAQRERLKGLEDMEQGLFSLRQGATEKGIGAEGKRMGELQEMQKAGIAGGVQQLGTEERARTATLDRESREKEAALNRQVQMAQVQAQRDANKIRSGELSMAQAEAAKARYLNMIRLASDAVHKRYETLLSSASMGLNSSDTKKQQQARQMVQDLEARRDAEIAKETKPFYSFLDAVGSPTGGSDANTGFKIVGVTPSR